MTRHDDLEGDLAASLEAAARRVPDDVTSRLVSGVADGAARHRRRRTGVLLLVAAVVLIAVVPTAAVMTRKHDREPPSAGSPSVASTSDVLRLSGQTWDGTDISTDDYLGAPLLVVAWGSWCAPCRSQATEVGALGGRTGVDVLGIDVRDVDRDVAGRVEGRLGLDYPSIWDASGDLAATLPSGSGGYPFTLLLDSRGRLIGSWAGATDPDAIEATIALAHPTNGAPPLLDGDVLAAAGRIARAQTERLKGVGVTATATVEPGVVPRPNIGEPCTSGHLIQIQLAGRFDSAVHAGAPGHDDAPTSGVAITADLETGEPCLLGVSTGAQTPATGAVTVYES